MDLLACLGLAFLSPRWRWQICTRFTRHFCPPKLREAGPVAFALSCVSLRPLAVWVRCVVFQETEREGGGAMVRDKPLAPFLWCCLGPTAVFSTGVWSSKETLWNFPSHPFLPSLCLLDVCCGAAALFAHCLQWHPSKRSAHNCPLYNKLPIRLIDKALFHLSAFSILSDLDWDSSL